MGLVHVSENYYLTLSQSNEVFIYARGEEYAIGDEQWDLPYVNMGEAWKIASAALY